MMITHGIVNGFEEGTEYIKIFSPPLTVQWRGGENPHIPAASQSLNSTRGINEAIAPSPSTATRGAEERTDKIWNVNRNNLFKITPSNKLTIKNNSFNNFPQGNNNQNEFGFLTEDDRRREDKYGRYIRPDNYVYGSIVIHDGVETTVPVIKKVIGVEGNNIGPFRFIRMFGNGRVLLDAFQKLKLIIDASPATISSISPGGVFSIRQR